MHIEIGREGDGRWIAEVPELPGVMAYGEDRDFAVARVQALALRVLRERLESGDAGPELLEAIEDVAFVLAIREGESSGLVSRDEVFLALGGVE
jgi:predicted RNase H-like HicB family nuclease